MLLHLCYTWKQRGLGGGFEYAGISPPSAISQALDETLPYLCMIWMLSIFTKYIDNPVLSRNLDFPAKRVLLIQRLEHQKYYLKLFCFSSNIDAVSKFSSLGLLTRHIKKVAKLVFNTSF